jgi:hypothetical protein
MWNVKTKAIPVIIETTETISESFRKQLCNIPGKHNTEELQTAILGTEHMFGKCYCGRYETVIMPNYITCTINCNHRVAATLCAL